MYSYISQSSLQHLPCIDLQDFNPGITVVEGSSGMVPEVLYRLCAASVISVDRDAIFVDGWNSFNPYALSRLAKSLGATPKKVLSRIHVARGFTEYQMDALLGESLCEAVESWNPAVLAISYLPPLFSGVDGRRIFEPLLERIKSLTASSGIITVITSFGGSWHGDRLLAAIADRVVRIEQPSKKLIKITDNGCVFEYMPVPSGQMRFTDFMNLDFTGGEVYGQNCTEFSQPA